MHKNKQPRTGGGCVHAIPGVCTVTEEVGPVKGQRTRGILVSALRATHGKEQRKAHAGGRERHSKHFPVSVRAVREHRSRKWREEEGR